MDKDSMRKTQKLAWLMIISCIIGLVFMPLFPWTSSTIGGTTIYSFEGGMAMFDPFDGDISLITLSFYLGLIFSIIALIGVMIYKTGRSMVGSRIVLIIGCVTILFSVLILFGHWNLLSHIDELAKNSGISISYGYNYIPLILGIVLMIGSILYTVTVVPVLTRQKQAAFVASPQPMARPQQYDVRTVEDAIDTKIQPVEKTPAAEPKTEAALKFCPGCGAKLTANVKFCPECGANL